MKGYYKGLCFLLTFMIVLGVLFNYGIVDTFGIGNNHYVEVSTYGTASQGDPMFSEGLWAPGAVDKGVMRLSNNYSQRVRVNNLALTIKLEQFVDGEYQLVNDPQLIETYAKNMYVTVTRGRLLVFDEVLFDDSFYEMMYEKGNYNFEGYSLPATKQFNIGRNNNVDLEYIVRMAEGGGNELQGLKATVDFIVNLQENPEYIDDYHPIERVVTGDDLNKTKDEVTSQENVHWAHDCIEKLKEEGIIQGYPDGTIRPNNLITRAETAVLIGRALKLEEKNKVFSGYMDFIPPWARGYIIATTEQGSFQGYPSTLGRVFKGNDYITREEVATALIRGFNIDLDDEKVLDFLDEDEIGGWALPYIRTGVKNDIILGYPDQTFKPKQEITRAEVFTLICKILDYHSEHLENEEE
ncbi:S-layer homology domain-containing protein [Alkaliphilus transvaalensis]|uniref:S-layer homology domain-containing protein n=1 Tax=Alkaliphilus transvaalensis TaxID=114628 RepID=UPI000479B7E3|nr:S-layer homology domain-containing protein [Alkaliphilus transvaalensis]